MSLQKKIRNNKPLLNPSGFTLIEVLVAITIFAIGLLAIAGMQVTGIRGNSTAHSVMAKVALADGVIEEFSAMTPDAAIVNADGTFNNWRTESVDGAGDLAADVVIDDDPIISGITYTGLTQITVTVTGPQGADIVKTFMKRRN